MRADDPNSAVVFDFLADLHEDQVAGRVRSLADYLARYPGHEEVIAAAFMRRQAEEAGAAGDAADPDERRVGPYRLIEELGRGGQGTVWRAEDTRIERTVALKLLTGFIVTQERRARMRREAESASRLAHPGICPVLEAEVEGEVPYLAMPLLEGQDLAHAFQEGWAPKDRAGLERVLRFFERAARALQAAHKAGLVHRDIKPGNVFVTPNGAPVLLDFGLARDFDDESDAITRSGDLCGTPAYMSPEQLRGTSSGLDRRTDVYSLGATLFEGLTGKRPFDGATYYELERAIRLDPVPDARAQNPSLPKDLAVVLATALDKDREHRYATAEDLAEDLRRVRAHEPVRARPLGRALRLVRWAQRQPAVAAASVTTFLALVIGLGVALFWLGEVMQANKRLEGRWFARRAADLAVANPTLSLLLGIDAAQALDDHEGRSALYGPLFTCQLERVFDMAGAARCWEVVVAGDQAVGLFTVPVGDTAEFTGHLVVFDLATGEPLWSFEHPDPLRCLDLHPSGKAAVVGTARGEVLGLDLVEQEVLSRARVGDEDDPVRCVEFATDARTFVALTGENLVRMEFPRAEKLRTLPLPPGASLSHVVHAPGDDYLLLSPRGRKGVLEEGTSVWLLERGPGDWTELVGSEPTPAAVNWAEWAPDHDHVLVADEAGVARLLALDGTEVARFTASAGLHAARLSPDGRRLALAGKAGEVTVHDLESGAELASFRHGGEVFRVAWSPDGTRLATTGEDTTTRVFDLDPPRQVALCRGSMRPVDLCWDPEGTRVLTWNLGYRIYLWGAGPMPYAYRLGGIRDVTSAVFAEDGAWTLSGGVLRRFGIERGGVYHRLEGLERVLHTGTDVVAVRDGLVLWVDPASGHVRVSAPGEPERAGDEVPGANEIVLGPKGRAAVVVGEDALHLVDARTGRTRWAHAGLYGRVAFSPDGGRLAVCAAERPAELLDVQTGAVIRALPFPARDLSWNSNGVKLALVEHTPMVIRGRLHLLDGDGDDVGERHDFQHKRVTWSPRGDALLGWSPGWAGLHLYRRADGGGLEPASFVSHDGSLMSVDFHPSGRWFALATATRYSQTLQSQVLILEVVNDEVRLFSSFILHEGQVKVVRFGPDPDDRCVLSAGEDGAFVWPLDPLPAALARRPREIERLEREKEREMATGLPHSMVLEK